MSDDKRPAYDLLREWIASDQPVYHYAFEVVKLNRDNQLDYGAGMRDLILDVRSNPNGYRSLVREFTKLPYHENYSADDQAARWTMRHMTDREFGAVDWTKLADDLFGEQLADMDDEK